MPGGISKYPLEIKVKAMTLWAEGVSYRDIAKKLGIKSFRTIQNWKNAKYPECWETYKQALATESVQKIKEEQLETMTQVKTRQQKQFRALAGTTAQLLSNRAAKGTLDPEIALQTFKAAVEGEQKLYVDVNDLHGRKAIGVGATGNAQTGEFKMYAYMEEQYVKSREGKGD